MLLVNVLSQQQRSRLEQTAICDLFYPQDRKALAVLELNICTPGWPQTCRDLPVSDS